ncbi:MAG TPA: glycosyltransferase, partial [Candidatus Wallbacteria bacterium]|nr:glycosyltransferase [Candidatus Wallbacteria bacterium]
MISVIIPVLNEERTIENVIRKALKFEKVTEIIVVDDASGDTTVERARLAGAKVMQSTKLGKGASMLDGLYYASNDLIIYLDGDIENYDDDISKIMTGPLISGEADFVKSKFSREAGRVTELVAKPLLSLLFPELVKFCQPLSGIISGKKEFFKKVEFENDYGVDIGILIDMHNLGVRIVEQEIGYIEHKSKQWRQLGKMSREVSRAILKRAQKSSKFTLEDLGSYALVSSEMDSTIKECVTKMNKMVIFDMDNTLLDGRVIYALADKFGFKNKLIEIVTENSDPYVVTKLIAKTLKGLNIGDILNEIDRIPVVSDAGNVIAELKKKGYIIGIISDSYDIAVQHLKSKLNIDFT